MSTERYLIDTNVLSELARVRPDDSVEAWFRQLSSASTSAMVCFELSRGIERLQRGKRRTFLESWLAELLQVVEVVPVDEATALAAARIEAAAGATGRSIEVRDLLIVATAQTHGCVLATRNVNDMRGFGVVVYDPFTDTRTL